MSQTSERRVGRPRGPRVDRAVRRGELLDGAARAIRRIGAGVNMEELAAEAGISKPVLYSYFGDKAGLANALADRYADDVRGRLLAVLTEPQEPRLMIRGLVNAFIGFVESEPAIFEFLLQRGLGDPGVPQRRVFDELGSHLTLILQFAISQSGGDPRQAEPWAFAMLGAVLSAAEWWAPRQHISRAELVDHITALFWSGLRGTARVSAPATPPASA